MDKGGLQQEEMSASNLFSRLCVIGLSRTRGTSASDDLGGCRRSAAFTGCIFMEGEIR